MKPPRVAVLGAGIMGSSVALFLARKGARVTLLDEATEAFAGASRWNEGKIHLGYLYAGDPSGKTGARLLPGGLAFKGLTEALIGCAIDDVITPEEETYLVHRDSVVSSEAMGSYFEKVTQTLREAPRARDYLVDVSASRVRPLSRRELARLTNSPLIKAGYRVPERSVQTNWIADRFVAALAAEARIEQRMSTRVQGVAPAGKGKWQVKATPPLRGHFDFIVNALWHGRLAVDRTAGLEEETPWSHRYRLSIFARTTKAVAAPSAVVATGPFGDLKNYNGRDFYLSWYPTGLLGAGTALAPPPLACPGLTKQRAVMEAIVQQLGEFLPAARSIAAAAVEMRLRGGWVFALGRGSLGDRRATLHRRDKFGVRALGSYISVDTGKYSTAPWLAAKITAQIL